MKRDHHDEVPLRLWILFGIGVAGGALLGVLVGLVGAITSGPDLGPPEYAVGTLVVAVLVGAMIGGIAGTVAAVGSLIAVLIFDRRMSRPARHRALIAGAGATVAVVIAWSVFVLARGNSSDSDFFFGGLLDRGVPLLATAAAISLLAGALAAVGVWRVERKLATRAAPPWPGGHSRA